MAVADSGGGYSDGVLSGPDQLALWQQQLQQGHCRRMQLAQELEVRHQHNAQQLVRNGGCEKYRVD